MALVLSKSEDCSKLILKSDLIELMYATGDPIPHDIITINIFRNCCGCDSIDLEITRTIPDPFLTVVIDSYEYNATTLSLEIDSKIEALTNIVWADGVYKVVVTISDSATGLEVQSESNCFFLECQTSCKVSKYIKKLLLTNTDTDAHLLHFGLTNGGNCNCNCDDLCLLYRKLISIIDNKDTCLCCK